MNIKWDKDKIFLAELVGGIAVLLLLIVLAIILLIKNDRKKVDMKIAVSEQKTTTVDSDMDKSSSEVPKETSNKNGAIIDLTKQSGNKAVLNDLSQIYIPGNMLSYTKDNRQLPELYDYWDKYNLAAVNDLIRLERVREVTNSLQTSNDYYYYGEKNSEGMPEGKGLAVYARDTYYFGEWKNGKRHGDGMWLQLFLDKDGMVNGIKGVKEHQYSGTWSNDLPNGSGQENLVYDYAKIDGEFVILNAIGDFKDGYYNGKMYFITVDNNGKTTDWYGTAQRGSFVYLNEKKNIMGKRAIWEVGDGYTTKEQDNCRWIMPEDNQNFGFSGLKK